MPELRKDPVDGRWVIIATERARRPGNVVESVDDSLEEDQQQCPFCHIDEPPIYSAQVPDTKSNGSLWDVRVIPFRKSFLTTQKKSLREKHGLYDVINSFGTHEVVIESPQHTANMADLDVKNIRLVIETYALRIKELERNPQFQYVLAYKNYGPTAGSRNIGHARSHIVATPNHPLRVKEKLAGAKEYFDKHKRCIYCDLINQELKDQERIVVETEHFLAVIPFAARFLFEVWILPKRHHCDFAKGVSGYEGDLAKMLKILLQKMKIGLDNRSYNYVIQTAPFIRPDGDSKKWQTIKDDYHWHIEVLPHLTRVAGFEKGTGFHICSIPPEQMAAYLKEIET